MPISLARAAQLAYVTMTDVPIVRNVSVLTQAERPASAAHRAVLDSLVAHGWRQVEQHAGAATIAYRSKQTF